MENFYLQIKLAKMWYLQFPIIEDLFIRSIQNPEAIKSLINYYLDSLNSTIICIVIASFIIWIIYYLYILLDSIKFKWNKIKKSDCKKSLLYVFQKAKKLLRKRRYFIIWYILTLTSRTLVSIIFRFWRRIPCECTFSDAENALFGVRAFYSLIIFIIASQFIMFCFWNKFIRNIWIFIYICWIIFITLWKLFNMSCIWI